MPELYLVCWKKRYTFHNISAFLEENFQISSVKGLQNVLYRPPAAASRVATLLTNRPRTSVWSPLPITLAMLLTPLHAQVVDTVAQSRDGLPAQLRGIHTVCSCQVKLLVAIKTPTRRSSQTRSQHYASRYKAQ